MDIQRHAQLYRRMKRAVAEELPEKVSELERIIADYTGDARILEHFLLLFGADNPWKAAQHAQLRQAIYRTPQEIKAEGEVHGVSVSGHKLSNQLFVLTHSYDPTRVWRSGARAITKIMEVFGSVEQRDAFTTEGKKKTEERKKQQCKKSLDELAETLADVLREPSRVVDVQSRNDRIKVHKILGLDDELKKRIMQLDKLVHGESAQMAVQSKGHLLALDKGGMFFGWFDRQLESLPAAIRDIYSTVTSSVVTIPETERAFMIGSLIAYAAVHMPLRRESVLGGYQKDLDFMTSLAADHPLRVAYGTPDLSSVRDILMKPEITLVEATRIFDVYPIDEVRKKINAVYKQQFANDIAVALKHITPLFIQDSKWRTDAYEASLPLQRLKKTAYAATLLADDFRAVRDLVRLQSIAQTEEKAYAAVCLQEYKTLIDKVAVVGRKLQYLEATVQLPAAIEEAAAFVGQWETRLLRRSNLTVAENFAVTHGISLLEFMKRASFGLMLDALWNRHEKRIEQEASYGLYTPELLDDLSPLITKVKAYVPMVECAGKFEQARLFLSAASSYSHLVVVLPLLPHQSVPYLFENQARFLDDLLQAKAMIGEKEKKSPAFAHCSEKLKQLREAEFYDGATANKIALRQRRYDRNVEPRTKIGEAVFLFALDKLEEYVAGITNNYTLLSNVSPILLSKARFVASLEAKVLLPRIGMEIAAKQVWTILYTQQRKQVYLANAFLKQVAQCYEQLERVYSSDTTVVRAGVTEFAAAQLYDSFSVVVKNTTRTDAGRFNDFFRELRWNGKEWRTERQITKGRIGDITERIAAYNVRYGTRLYVEIERR